MTQRGVRSRRDEIVHREARIFAGDQAFADQNGVGSRLGVGDQVMRLPNTRFCDLYAGIRDEMRHACEDTPVDFQRGQVSGIHADDVCPCVQGTGDLRLIVHLDQWRQPQTSGALDK